MTICEAITMTKETAQLIEEYKKEYERVNGRVPQVQMTSAKSQWIEAEKRFYRKSELALVLDLLKSRASFYS